ncbi:MAG TPA: threonine/serine dehydratase [Thermoanaerobaculia bacterium]|nr:threonine/serine dehydratase [Thermoanaerobaculia bacterium]
MVDIADVRAARERIRDRVRRTPLVHPGPVHDPLPGGGRLSLKLECLQVTGSFKARGATNKLLTLPAEEVRRGLVTASGGNHGLGVAYAGWQAKTPATIYLPANAPESKADKLRLWGAEVVRAGEVWDDANAAAQEFAAAAGRPYVHPFADSAIIAGQGTIALEVLEDAPETDVLLVAIGGGGLISGVALAAKALKPGIQVIGVEPVGAPTLYESLRAGRVVELAEIRTAANTLAARRTEPIDFDIIRANVDEIVLVTDEEMRAAARWLWFELGIAAELSGAASLAALQAGRYRPPAGAQVCALICGAGTDGIGGERVDLLSLAGAVKSKVKGVTLAAMDDAIREAASKE